MADFPFNIALGRIIEYYNRVESNDPANSALIVVLGLGAVTDATLRDLDTLQDVLDDAGFTESSDGSYARKTLTDVELAALPAPDDANDRREVDIPDQTFTGMTGESITRMLICYDDDTTGGTDTNIVPLCFYDAVITTDGNDFTIQINANGFFRAQG